MTSPLLFAAVFTPFGASVLAPYLGRLLGKYAGYLLALSFIPALALVQFAPAARGGTPAEFSLPWVPAIGLELSLRADGFSLMFALIVAGIGFLIFCYAAAYLGSRERHGRFYSYLLIFGGAMLGLVLADNLIALFGFWEVTSLSSFLLIGFWDSRKASVDGATKALVITAIGGLALLVAVILLILAGGSGRISALDVAAFRQSPLFTPAVIMLLVAAFTKSAQLPFHLWLPTAMEAPTPVSAYLHSATMVKAGVILIAKLGFIFVDSSFSPIIMYFGLATLFWGSYLAIRQEDLKALLAYSTVSQLGLLMSLYGSGHSFAATAHLLNHAAFKAALFMVVGIIDHETGSRDISKLSGLRRKLPVTFMLALPAALSMAGLPIFGGAISKELFYEEMLGEGFLPIAIAVTGSIMTFAYSLRFLKVFFGNFRCEKPQVHEAHRPFWLPALPLVLAVIAFGVVPLKGTGNPFTSTTVATWFTNLAAPTFGYPAFDISASQEEVNLTENNTEGASSEAAPAEAVNAEGHRESSESHEVKGLHIWHGLNLALGLSVLTWLLGTVLHLYRDPFNKMQVAITPGWNINTIYYLLLGGLERLSAFITQRTQGATFATQVRMIFLTVVAVGGAVGWRHLPGTVSPVPLEVWAVAVTIVAGAIGVVAARSRLSAIIFMGLVGIAPVLAFVFLRAPDLALTQLLIETVTIILFLSVFRFLPRLSRYERPRFVAIADALLASGVGATVFTALIAVQHPIAPRIKDYFIDNAKTLGGGNNVVNVILVDFRGYDTMGEITVLSVVAIAVYALLKVAVNRPPKLPEDES